MSELQQLEKLQKMRKEIGAIKVVDVPNVLRDELRKTSREQIFMAGQLNVLLRITQIIDKYDK
jgi:hypothetical protein